MRFCCRDVQDKSSNTGVPAEGVDPEATRRRGSHGAHVQLVIQQVRVPRETPAAGDRGVGHPSVVCAPTVVALHVQICRHPPNAIITMNNNETKMAGLLPSLWNQAGTSLYPNISVYSDKIHNS